jgi:hypothetical protein
MGLNSQVLNFLSSIGMPGDSNGSKINWHMMVAEISKSKSSAPIAA